MKTVRVKTKLTFVDEDGCRHRRAVDLKPESEFVGLYSAETGQLKFVGMDKSYLKKNAIKVDYLVARKVMITPI